MRKLISTLLIMIMVISTASVSFADDVSVVTTAVIEELSVEDAVKLAISTSEDLSVQDLDIDAKKTASREAVSDTRRISDSNSGTVSINTYYANKGILTLAAENNVIFAEETKKSMIDGIELSIKSEYYNLANSLEELEIKKRSLERLNSLNSIAKTKYDLGLINATELLSAKVNVNNALIEIQNLENNIAISKMSLNLTIGRPLDVDFTLSDKLEYREYTKEDLISIVELSEENNLEVMIAKLSYELAKATYDVDGLFYQSNSSSLKNSRVARDKAELNYKKSLSNVEFKVYSKYADIKNAERSYNSLLQNLELLKQSYNNTLKLYELGMTTQNEVEAASISLEEMELTINKGILGYNLAILDFEMLY